MAKHHPASRNHMRERICDLAARLMADDGIQDYALAKRKAARQLGAVDTRYLPDNHELEDALRQRLALYNPQQASHVKILREQALNLMQQLAPFSPRLIGSVLSGSATRYVAPTLLVFCNDLNEILFFLMQETQTYKLTEQRFKLNGALVKLPVVHLAAPLAEASLIVVPMTTPGLHLCAADGREIDSADIKRVQALLNSPAIPPAA